MDDPVKRTKEIKEPNPTLPSAAATHKKYTEKNLSLVFRKMKPNKTKIITSSIIKQLNDLFLLKLKTRKKIMDIINAKEKD
jgi:hypothetical protein